MEEFRQLRDLQQKLFLNFLAHTDSAATIDHLTSLLFAALREDHSFARRTLLSPRYLCVNDTTSTETREAQPKREQVLIIEKSEGFNDPPKTPYVRIGTGVTGRAAETRKLVIENDVAALEGDRHIPNGSNDHIGAEMAMPLIGPNRKLYGVIDVQTPDRGTYDKQHELFFKLLARDFTNKLACRERNQRDGLTGILKRDCLFERFVRETKLDARLGQPLSLALLDLDFFKRINDRYGHDKGDEVLARVGEVLTDNYRKDDVAIRYGGDEFLLLLPGTDRQGALNAIERTKRILRYESRIYGRGTKHIPILFSHGISTLSHSARNVDASANDLQPMLRRLITDADMRLYREKQRISRFVERAWHSLRI